MRGGRGVCFVKTSREENPSPGSRALSLPRSPPSPSRGEGKCRAFGETISHSKIVRSFSPYKANAPPPGFERRGCRLPSNVRFLAMCASFKCEGGAGRRGPGGPTGLDISRHRGIVEVPQVRRFLSVPRAVFEACSVRPPVVGLFQDPSRCGALPWGLNHRSGTSMRPARWRGVTVALPRVPLLRSCRYGISRLGPPGRGVRSAPLISHSRATAPDPPD